MATTQEKSSVLNNTPPLEEHEGVKVGCGSYCLFCFKWRRCNSGAPRYLLQQQQGESREPRLMGKLKKAKEITKLLSWPKWKTFIRKLSVHGNNKKQRPQFQYDLQSYVLNFDDGIGREVDDASKFSA